MSKKKQIKNIFESARIESSDVNDDLKESDSVEAQNGATSSEEENTQPSQARDEASDETSAGSEDAMAETDLADLQREAISEEENLSEGMEAMEDSQEPSGESAAQAGAGETSNDDLLEDVRRSLIEAEGEKSQKGSKWWQRFGRKAKKAEPEQPPVEIDLPPLPVSMGPPEESPVTSKAEDEIDEIDDLIDLLKAEAPKTTSDAVTPVEQEAPPEPEPEIDFEELKKQAFTPRPEEEEPENFTDVRSVALEGGEEVLVEVDRTPPDPWEERVKAFENALRPYRTYINITLVFLGVVAAAIASLVIFNVYQQTRPQPTQPVSNLPYPTAVSLPGGWSFNLGKGTLLNGKWEPKGAEWLQGTEVCRWVALPWSRQLEAVVRTLNSKDPIDLVMSNNDKLVYQVYSVQQLTPEEMQQVDSNSPCLLVILTQPDAEKRWVLTAVP